LSIKSVSQQKDLQANLTYLYVATVQWLALRTEEVARAAGTLKGFAIIGSWIYAMLYLATSWKSPNCLSKDVNRCMAWVIHVNQMGTEKSVRQRDIGE